MIVGYEDLKWLNRKVTDQGVVYFEDEHLGIMARVCSSCERIKYINSFVECKDNTLGFRSQCRGCKNDAWKKDYEENPEKYYIKALNRRAYEKGLPDTLTDTCLEDIAYKFGGRCALTGSEAEIHLDHVIPISIGRGGTIRENMIPLRADLNISKSNRNIFEWFSDNQERFKLSQRKFDELIEYLADINEMTVEEYRDYVYWCHDNPRTVGEIIEERAEA